MGTLLSLTPFQMVFVGGFIVLAWVLTLVLRTRKLLSFVTILVIALLLLHFLMPVVTSLAHL